MPLGKLDRINERWKRRLARGITPADVKRIMRENEAKRIEGFREAQERINKAHAEWVAAGMPTNAPMTPDKGA